MVLVEFQPDKILLSKAALGGYVNLGITYDKFPGLKALDEKELAHLSDALTIALAKLELHVAQAGMQGAVATAAPPDEPQVIMPPEKKLVVPA